MWAWNQFIENTAHHLKNLLDYYHEYALDAKEKIDVFNYNRNTVGQDEEDEEEDERFKRVECEKDLDDVIDYIDMRDVVFHSPTKPRTARTLICTSKSDNFLQKIQGAMTDDDEYDEY
ncbi:hypothetical protein BGZ98_006473 [Dissophora globulifera]|nr:hypothetical protein BGZ98_006473 [Dissophora globulifera]